MTTYKQGDVLLVPYPFTDQSGTKQRPAVVLSSTAYNQNHADLILAPITSQITNPRDDAILQNWEAAGLLKPSSVKPLLSSLETSLVRRHLGRLSSADLAQVRTLFARIFELK